MNLTIQVVDVGHVHQVWPRVEKFIEDASQYAQDDFSLSDVKHYVSKGEWQLLVAVDEENHIHGAATIFYFNRPSHRVAYMSTIGGRLITGKQTFEQFRDIVQHYGATYLEGCARESLARLWARYGAKVKYQVIGLPL